MNWISVKDRLPEDEETHVLVYRENGWIEIWPRRYFHTFRVTHWMPLPEPPKEEPEVIQSDVRMPPPELVEAMKGKDLWIGNEAFAKCMEDAE